MLPSRSSQQQLTVVADRTVLRADDSDLSFIAIELRDENGNLASASDTLVRVGVEGPAVLQALGSARPDTEERFDSGEHTTFNGRALVSDRLAGGCGNQGGGGLHDRVTPGPKLGEGERLSCDPPPQEKVELRFGFVVHWPWPEVESRFEI